MNKETQKERRERLDLEAAQGLVLARNAYENRKRLCKSRDLNVSEHGGKLFIYRVNGHGRIIDVFTEE